MKIKKRKRRQPLPKEVLERLTCNDCNVNVLKIGEYYNLQPDLWENKLGLGWTDTQTPQIGRR
jgi:hypothetical protein